MLIDGRSISSIFTRQLGYAQPCTNGHVQHRPVADAIACRRIGCVEQSLQLLPQQIGNQARIRFLERDRQHAADLLQGSRLPAFEEAEEGLDGR
ncbi:MULTISPECIES: hypothetical protein [unclassified Bradyrhizobium]|uniref:hypothetical protein n=1 Tax=unclassified Bradyrhizobium TaxID=2631580 RepID=UPI001FFE829C|nr:MULTISPECIES: hypothetical protein [unclassified Bradyrhizobium]